jgi:hypothetical protein
METNKGKADQVPDDGGAPVEEMIAWALEHGADTTQLLARWLQWWWDDVDMPAKIPGGLHVETAVELSMRYGAWQRMERATSRSVETPQARSDSQPDGGQDHS